MVDFSKAFDSVNHLILIRKLNKLPVPNIIVRLVYNFLKNRSHFTVYNKIYSQPAFINKSIVQGSVLGPILFIILINDLKPVSEVNKIVKYADDVTLIFDPKSAVSFESEFKNIVTWSDANKLAINYKKTNEIIFHRNRYELSDSITPLPNITRVQEIKLLGLQLCASLNMDQHITRLITTCNQRLYLLYNLKHYGLSNHKLAILYKALILSKLTYAIPAWRGFMRKSDEAAINKHISRAHRNGYLTENPLDFEEHCNKIDIKLFNKIKSDISHCLHHLLPPINSYKSRLRPRHHNFHIPHTYSALQKNTYMFRVLHF
jgi:hypothetical protein